METASGSLLPPVKKEGSPTNSTDRKTSTSSAASSSSKRTKVTVACTRCRAKRVRCCGNKPTCVNCASSQVACVYDLGSDRRKPYTKEVVSALHSRIQALEQELASVNINSSSSSTFLKEGVQFYSGPGINTGEALPDVFSGGLALNAHGEIRFFGPTSSFNFDTSSSSASQVEAARAFTLLKAPVPFALPHKPRLPREPPILTPEFQQRLIQNALSYCFAGIGLVSEREFLHDLHFLSGNRTANYSPFLLYVILAIGCRYLNPEENYPIEICSDINDRSTRGDVFSDWARYLIDQEWYHPQLSTVSALAGLAIYLAGRGLDGPATMMMCQSTKLCENFGLHLGLHRLRIGSGDISDAFIETRRNVFYAVLGADVMLSSYIGRPITLSDLDHNLPIVDHQAEYDEPFFRSSSFVSHSQLVLIGSKMMATLYNPTAINLAARQAVVPELHLALETWYHELPAHLRSAMSVAAKAPDSFVIGLNLFYFLTMILLHRPFFRRVSMDSGISLSTEKCLSSAKHIVRLVKLQKSAHGLRHTAPAFQHALFCCGTILALSAVEDGLSNPLDSTDAVRRAQATLDLRYIIDSLREVGITWPAANTSASVLEALMSSWGTTTPVAVEDVSENFWVPNDANASFPFIFPSWELDDIMAFDTANVLY